MAQNPNNGGGRRKLIDAVAENSNPEGVSVLTSRQVLSAALTGCWGTTCTWGTIARNSIPPLVQGVCAFVRGCWATGCGWGTHVLDWHPRVRQAWNKLVDFVLEVVWHSLVVTCSKRLIKLCEALFEVIKVYFWK